LQGRELTPYIRVLAVSDVFEALTADRPYRAGMSVDQALEIMRWDVGSHLCGETIDALERGLRAALPLAA
jgi:HD-GYP domain-containing protein (c-di-GMP phosphodiesterase class II)